MVNCIRIATRKSRLALYQANWVADALKQLYPTLEVNLVAMTTQGDQILDQSLTKIGGKGLFIKELEQALLENRADIAVHSMKDVPPVMTEQLLITAICERESPWDAFVSNHLDHINQLKKNMIIGTSSLRRQCQVLSLFPNIQVKLLRGNVETRLKKLDDQQFDAIILAQAGLKRLGLSDRTKHVLKTPDFIPAIGQGAIGVQCRANDEAIIKIIQPLNHKPTALCIKAERAVAKRLEGNCQTPIGGYACIQGKEILLVGLVGRPDGSTIIRYENKMHVDQAEILGLNVAEALLNQGAYKILEELK